MRIGPPNVLVAPNPRSSIRTITTLGAPAGAFTSNRFGIFALRTSKVVLGGMRGSCTGRTVRLTAGCADAAVAQTAASTGVSGNFAIRFMEMLRYGCWTTYTRLFPWKAAR